MSDEFLERIAISLEGIADTLSQMAGPGRDDHERELTRVKDEAFSEILYERETIARDLGMRPPEKESQDIAAWYALPYIRARIAQLVSEHRTMEGRLVMLERQKSGRFTGKSTAVKQGVAKRKRR